MNPAWPPRAVNSALTCGGRLWASGRVRRWHDRVVVGTEEERRPADPREVGAARRLRPVVHLVAEAVERRRHHTVVAGEGPRPARRRDIDEARVVPRLLDHLRPHGLQEVGGVDETAEASVEHARAGGHVEGHRDADRPENLRRRCLTDLPEPLQKDVAAEGHADDADGNAGCARGERLDQPGEIAGVAGVVEAREAVQLAAAGSEVEGDAVPAGRAADPQQPGDVVRAR